MHGKRVILQAIVVDRLEEMRLPVLLRCCCRWQQQQDKAVAAGPRQLPSSHGCGGMVFVNLYGIRCWLTYGKDWWLLSRESRRLPRHATIRRCVRVKMCIVQRLLQACIESYTIIEASEARWHDGDMHTW